MPNEPAPALFPRPDRLAGDGPAAALARAAAAHSSNQPRRRLDVLRGARPHPGRRALPRLHQSQSAHRLADPAAFRRNRENPARHPRPGRWKSKPSPWFPLRCHYAGPLRAACCSAPARRPDAGHAGGGAGAAAERRIRAARAPDGDFAHALHRRLRRACGRTRVAWPRAIIIGVLAAAATGIKPYFVLVPAFLECAVLVRAGWRSAFGRSHWPAPPACCSGLA